MLFIKKIFVLILIFSFFTQSLSATPFFSHVRTHLGDDVLDIHEYPGAPVRISSPSNPKEVFYISQERARRFLGVSPYGTPISPSENIQMEELLVFSGQPLSEGRTPPLMRVTYSSRLLSRVVCQEEMQCAVVRESMRPFLTLHLDVEFLDVAGLIFCSSSVEDVSSFEGNIFKADWVESNQPYLKLNQHYRLRFSKFNPRSILVDGASGTVVHVDYLPEEKTSWLELFFPFPRDAREERARAFPRDSVTALALLSVSLNPTLRLCPDFEERRRGIGSHIFYDLQREGYNGFFTKLDSRTVDRFLAQDPEYSILRLFESPLIFETRMRVSVLREAIESMRRAQRALRELQNPPKDESEEELTGTESEGEQREEASSAKDAKAQVKTRRKFSRSRAPEIPTVSSFLRKVAEIEERESPPRILERSSPWEDASLVYEALLYHLFDVSNGESLPNADILGRHLKRYADILQAKGMPFAPQTTKAPQEMRFSPRMNNWLYALLKNSRIFFSDALPWALYFGFNVNHRPSPEDPSLVMYYTRMRNFEALQLLLSHKASIFQEGETPSPLDEAVRQRYKDVFCLFLRRSSQSPRTSLSSPQEALNWYHELENREELDADYKAAFNALSGQHPSFAWLRLLDRFLIRRDVFLESWKRTERRKLERAGREFEVLLREMRQIPEQDRRTYLERYSFEYFGGVFRLQEDASLVKVVREEIREKFKRNRGGSSRELEDFQEARPGVSMVEEFYSVEMMRRFLEEKLLRPLILRNGQSLTQAHQELKKWAIAYLCSLESELREDGLDDLPVCAGYFGSYVLPPSFRKWLEERESIPPDGISFRLIGEEPISIYPCGKWVTRKMAAHVFLSGLPGPGSQFECLRIGSEDTGYRAVSVFSERETLATSSFVDRDKTLRIQTRTQEEYSIAFESLSHHLIRLLLLMPRSHLQEDTILSLRGKKMHFSLGGRDQDFFQVSPFRSHTNILTVEMLQKIPVDPKARAFFQNLDPEKAIVDWLVQLVRLQSLQAQSETEEVKLPLSHQELGAFYLRLKLLRHIFRESQGPLTHWDLLRYMNPWKIHNLQEPAGRLKVHSEALVLPPLFQHETDVRHKVVTQVFRSWMQDGDMGVWFGDWAAFPEGSLPIDCVRVIRTSQIFPTCLVIPETHDVQEEDWRDVSLQGASLLAMENQEFGKATGGSSLEVSRAIKQFFSRVSESTTLRFLNVPRLGRAHLLQQNVVLGSESLVEVVLDGTPFQQLSIAAPSLRRLSLRECASLTSLSLRTPCLNNLDLTRAAAFTDESFRGVVKSLSGIEVIRLEGTRVSFPDFRALALAVEEEEFGLLAKRLVGTLEDFLNGRGKLQQSLLCGDTVDQVRRVLGKTVTGPLRDVRTIGLWAQRTWHKWRSSSSQDITGGKKYGATDVLRAPLATPLAATAGGLGYLGMPLVVAHPALWAAAPVVWWVGGSVKSVRREIEEGKRKAEVLLGKVLARAVKERGGKTVNLEGIGLNVAGVLSFFMEGGADGLDELNLENNELGDAGGEFLRGVFSEGNHRGLVVKLKGNDINRGLLLAIQRLTSSEEQGSPVAQQIQVEDERSEAAEVPEGPSESHRQGGNLSEGATAEGFFDPVGKRASLSGTENATRDGVLRSIAEESEEEGDHREERIPRSELPSEEIVREPPSAGQGQLSQVSLGQSAEEFSGDASSGHLQEDLLERHEGGEAIAREDLPGEQGRPRSVSPFEVIDPQEENAGRTFFALHINGALGPNMNEVLAILEIMEGMLQRPLGEFFHAMGGSHLGALVGLVSSVPPAPSSRFSFSRPVPPSVSQFRRMFDEVSSPLEPNYNLGDQEPLFSWHHKTGAFWDTYFQDRSIGDARTSLALTLEREGEPVVVTEEEEGEEKLSASYVATTVAHLPWPYHVGPSESVIYTSPQRVVEGVKTRFPGAQDGKIHVISLDWSIDPQDLRNAERNGGKVISEEVFQGSPPYPVFQFFFRGNSSSWCNPPKFSERREARDSAMRKAFEDWFRMDVIPVIQAGAE